MYRFLKIFHNKKEDTEKEKPLFDLGYRDVTDVRKGNTGYSDYRNSDQAEYLMSMIEEPVITLVEELVNRNIDFTSEIISERNLRRVIVRFDNDLEMEVVCNHMGDKKHHILKSDDKTEVVLNDLEGKYLFSEIQKIESKKVTTKEREKRMKLLGIVNEIAEKNKNLRK